MQFQHSCNSPVKLIQKMNQRPLSQHKHLTNQPAALSQAQNYSPNLPSLNEIQKNENQADSIEKILSSSIQRAKQKINLLEGRQREERSENKHQRTSSKDSHSHNAIAGAMKVLQTRVRELQQSVQNQERERNIISTELDNLSNEKKLILNNLEESNRKMGVLEHNHKNSRMEVKQLTQQLEDAQNQKNQLEAKCQTLEMTVRHLEKDKQQLNSQLSKRQHQSSMKSHPPIQKHHDDKERVYAERERRLQDKEKRLLQFQQFLKEKQGKSASDKSQRMELVEENDQMNRQILQLKQQLSDESAKERQQKENYEVYLHKIKEMQGELQILRQTTKNMQPNEMIEDSEEIQNLRQDLHLYQNKYDELLRLFKRNEDKSKREEKEIKFLKDKVRELEDLLTEIVEKIGKLPTTTKDLKYLAVKAGKIFSNNLEKAINLKTPTKSRSNSLNRSLSRSNSQRKNTQISQLNNSRTSNKGPQSGSKSKKKISTGSGSKSKRIVVSQSGIENVQRQVGDLKKEYKRLVKALNETQDETIRSKLNEIAFAIQQKSEHTTKQRQQNRLK